MKPIYDDRALGNLSELEAQSSAEPPAAYAAYSELVESLMDLSATSPPVRPGDAAKRGVLDQFAAALGDLSG